ncbi:MAG: acetyl-CoA carboxylase, biotin carboxyl carrier protein [Endomicrobia bacterium]|nr:acetyl-CoA carboxylase, biotin carboxyl carrier protein [Endomicrobiia bacterium]
MNPQEIKEFLKSIHDTDIEEIHYENGENSLYMKKNHVEAIVPAVKVKEVPAKEKAAAPKSTIAAIKSTMVGTFAIAPSNDKPPFVMEGDNVKSGQKVGQIEAMKILKDIHSNVSGKIIKISVSNGQSVEYGQELFLVDTK